MNVSTLFFGHYREIVPDGKIALELPDGATVAEAASLLAQREPRLTDLLSRTRAAVNAEFSPAATILRDGDEIAFLPPMSGG